MDKSDMVYEVSRFDPSAQTERLVERIGLVDRGGSLLFRSADGSEIACRTGDLDAEIAARPELHEAHANQITRIAASPGALAHLPFLLRITGDADDFDESRWSPELREAHVDGSNGELRGAFRVLYVNDRQWGAFERRIREHDLRAGNRHDRTNHPWGGHHHLEIGWIGPTTPSATAR